ncbi:MAG: M28 family peptidase [Gemmatimonadales bacterium]|nr:M28 family peptidase [Gemmatimonadales bacterium]
MSLMRALASTALTLAAACQEPAPPREFDGASAFRYLEQQVALGPRVPGTEAHRQAGRWIDSLARAKADTVVVQEWTHVTAKGVRLELRNVLARFNPGAAERILFLAHWDSRPRADAAGSRDPKAPVPGANDGASGVALLLGVADVLASAPPAVGVDLLFVDGEDFGSFEDTTETLIGSRFYARHQPPGPRPLFAVLWDMVADRDQQFYQEGNSLLGAPEVVERVWETARKLGHGGVFIASPKWTLTDDHVPLQQVGIRAIDVIDYDYPAWHTPDDTIDKVSAASLQRAGDVAVGVVRREQ